MADLGSVPPRRLATPESALRESSTLTMRVLLASAHPVKSENPTRKILENWGRDFPDVLLRVNPAGAPEKRSLSACWAPRGSATVVGLGQTTSLRARDGGLLLELLVDLQGNPRGAGWVGAAALGPVIVRSAGRYEVEPGAQLGIAS